MVYEQNTIVVKTFNVSIALVVVTSTIETVIYEICVEFAFSHLSNDLKILRASNIKL